MDFHSYAFFVLRSSDDFYPFKSIGRNESQMSISVSPLSNNIEFSLPKYDGNVETVKFEGISVGEKDF